MPDTPKTQRQPLRGQRDPRRHAHIVTTIHAPSNEPIVATSAQNAHQFSHQLPRGSRLCT